MFVVTMYNIYVCKLLLSFHHKFRFLSFFFARERTRTNFFANTRKKLQCHNPIKYSNRTTLDNDLRILATACNHRVPSATADLEQIIENYRNKASRVKSVQNHVSHDYNRTVYQKQNLNQCKSPITINNQWAPFSMPHSPPYYETQSPPPYMHHRTPSPVSHCWPPYMQHTTSNLRPQSPRWHSPFQNVNYSRPNLSPAFSPQYHYSPMGGYHQKPHQTHPNHSHRSFKTRLNEHDHPSKKRLN